jgi:hypothetical protein
MSHVGRYTLRLACQQRVPHLVKGGHLAVTRPPPCGQLGLTCQQTPPGQRQQGYVAFSLRRNACHQLDRDPARPCLRRWPGRARGGGRGLRLAFGDAGRGIGRRHEIVSFRERNKLGEPSDNSRNCEYLTTTRGPGCRLFSAWPAGEPRTVLKRRTSPFGSRR